MTLVLAYQSIFRSHFEDISFSRAISRLSVGATAKFAASDDSHFIKHEWCHHPTIAALTSQPAPHPHFINKDNEMTKGPKVVVDTRLTTYYNTWLTSTIST